MVGLEGGGLDHQMIFSATPLVRRHFMYPGSEASTFDLNQYWKFLEQLFNFLTLGLSENWRGTCLPLESTKSSLHVWRFQAIEEYNLANPWMKPKAFWLRATMSVITVIWLNPIIAPPESRQRDLSWAHVQSCNLNSWMTSLNFIPSHFSWEGCLHRTHTEPTLIQ